MNAAIAALPRLSGVSLRGQSAYTIHSEDAPDFLADTVHRAVLLPTSPNVLIMDWRTGEVAYQVSEHLATVALEAFRWRGTAAVIQGAPYRFLLGGRMDGEGVRLDLLHSDGTRSSPHFSFQAGPRHWQQDGSLLMLDMDGPAGEGSGTPGQTLAVLCQPEVLREVLALWGISFHEEAAQ